MKVGILAIISSSVNPSKLKISYFLDNLSLSFWYKLNASLIFLTVPSKIFFPNFLTITFLEFSIIFNSKVFSNLETSK